MQRNHFSLYSQSFDFTGLIQAYREYLDYAEPRIPRNVQMMNDHRLYLSVTELTTIKVLFLKIGEAQTSLPHYVAYEYFRLDRSFIVSGTTPDFADHHLSNQSANTTLQHPNAKLGKEGIYFRAGWPHGILLTDSIAFAHAIRHDMEAIIRLTQVKQIELQENNTIRSRKI